MTRRQINVKPNSRKKLERAKEMFAVMHNIDVDKVSFSDAIDFLDAQSPKTKAGRIFTAFDNFKAAIVILAGDNPSNGDLPKLVGQFRTIVACSLNDPERTKAFLEEIRLLTDKITSEYPKEPAQKEGEDK